MTAFLPRELAGRLKHALRSMPVVAVTGMRQTGKTTLLREEPSLRGRRYVTLDDFASLEAARRDPEGLVAGEEPLTIDEAQKCPELLTAIKREVDRRRTAGRYLLSGSANFGLLKGISESLAGRAAYLPLLPFTRREVARRTRRAPLLVSLLERGQLPRSKEEVQPVRIEEVLLGGMPSVCLGETPDPSLWFQGFEQTYLERDLRDLSQVADLVAFRRLMRLAALRTGQVLNQSEIGRDAALNAATTARYLSLLETSFLVLRLPPFLSNRSSREIRAPKLYFSDSGLAAWLAGLTRRQVEPSDPLYGALFETYALQNLAGILSAHLPEARVCYWNVQGRHEVDFVIEWGRDSAAIEVNSGPRWERRDLAGLDAFRAASPGCRVAVLAYNGRETVRLGEGMWAVPLERLLG